MRTINSKEIENAIEKLCIEANYYLPEDVAKALDNAINIENSELAKEILGELKTNYKTASCQQVPICQDTGMAVVYAEIGQKILVDGDSIGQAINNGVRKGYKNGYLRCSVVKDPLNRVNTNDNTPAVIHYDMVEGDKIKLTVTPKGFGSENMSALKMLKPSDGLQGVKDFIIETVKKAGSNPCPPIVVGVGIGGTMEKAAFLAKKALSLDIDSHNDNEFYAQLEDELLAEINKLNIGVSGLGGKTTALGINILTFPTHIAGLPVAVNISCHVTRHKSITL